MSALIPVMDRPFGDEGIVPTVNARDLHAFLEVGKVFSTWIQDRVSRYNFVENQDFVCFPILGSKGRGGRNRKDFHLTLDMAKELSMVERTEKGKQARLYFLACERRAKAATMPDVTQVLGDPAQLRTLLLGYTEKVLALEAQVREQTPKVQFHDAVTEAINGQSVREVAKVLGTGEKRLFKFLREEGLLMRNNLPYQQYLDAGYFRVVEGHYTDSRSERHTYTRTLVTGKGLVYIQKRLQAPRDFMQGAGPGDYLM